MLEIRRDYKRQILALILGTVMTGLLWAFLIPQASIILISVIWCVAYAGAYRALLEDAAVKKIVDSDKL